MTCQWIWITALSEPVFRTSFTKSPAVSLLCTVDTLSWSLQGCVLFLLTVLSFYLNLMSSVFFIATCFMCLQFIISSVWITSSRRMVIMNCSGCGRKQSRSDLRYCSCMFPGETVENHENPSHARRSHLIFNCFNCLGTADCVSFTDLFKHRTISRLDEPVLLNEISRG
jgi:hypothetical protein